MKLLTTLFLAVACITTYAQTDTKRCEFSTDGTSKSLGLKVKFQHPCSWEETKSNSPTCIKKFQTETKDGIAVVQQIEISTPAEPLTPERFKEMLAAEEMKKQVSVYGMFLWGRRMKIDGKDCGEVAQKTIKTVSGKKYFMYSVAYRILHNGKLVSIVFACAFRDEAACKKYLNDNKVLMLSLASATKFL